MNILIRLMPRLAPPLLSAAPASIQRIRSKAMGFTGKEGDVAHGKDGRSRRRRRAAAVLIVLCVIALLLIAARLALEPAVVWYVNRTIDRDPRYDGEIEGVDINLWRGAYAIRGIRLNKVTGNVPVPLFRADLVDLSLQWDALMERSFVGEIAMHRPELNFVDGGSSGENQTGANGPWLEILRDLFPLEINRCTIMDGSIHFRSDRQPVPVNVYLSRLEATVDDLTNIRDSIQPMIAVVNASGLAMDQAEFEFHMELNPFSYRPTFHMTTRLLNLDVTKVNNLARAYGSFDFEHGWFDLVIQADATEGQLEGYVKPLFRDLSIISAETDIPEDNLLQLFWETLLGVGAEVFQNQPRDQFGTLIRYTGDMSDPSTNLLEIVGNVLRNAFIRAYLPRLEDVAVPGTLEFRAPELSDPISLGTEN